MELLTTKLLHCFCLDSLRNTHVLFDESDSLGDAAADNVFRPSPLNVLKLVTGPSMAPLVSAMNCSHTVFGRRSTSFMESWSVRHLGIIIIPSYNYNNNNVHIPSPCWGGRCSGCRSPG